MDIEDPQLSIVIPFFNESGNAGPLVEEIHSVLHGRLRYELVLVDDGSTDGTARELEALEKTEPRIRLVRHGANQGQSAAIRSGVKAARARVVAMLDGDGQNDPGDIPSLFGRLTTVGSLGMVVGERRQRHDRALRRISSKIANGVRAWLLGDGIRDTGCGIKVFYRDRFLELPAFDHMHRFLPALMQRNGGKVSAIPVNHRPRRHGKSKYGIGNRLWVGIVDMLGVLWLKKRRI